MAYTKSWDENQPSGASVRGFLIDDHMRDMKVAIRERMEGDSNLTGLVTDFENTVRPKAGMARVFYGIEASINLQPLEDGRLYVTTDTHQLYSLLAAGYQKLRQSSILGGTSEGNIPANSTVFLFDQNEGALGNKGGIRLPFACIVRNLYVGLISSPGAGEDYEFTLMKGPIAAPVATALTATISNAETTAQDIVNTVACNAGQDIFVRIITSTSATPRIASWAVEVLH